MVQRRRRKPTTGTPEDREKARQSRMYFNADTQAAVVEYQTEDDFNVRNKTYVTKIAPAFEKLVENLINIHKFTSAHDTYETLKNDCVCFLFETLNKFDPTRGCAAFSYFNVCAKNWLIIRTKQKSQSTKKFLSIDDPESLTLSDYHILEEKCSVQAQDEQLEDQFASQEILDRLHVIRENVSTENELSTLNGIITLFQNKNEIDIVSKAAMSLYMKDLTNLSHKQLITAIAVIKRLYMEQKEEDENDY